jgi:hypothetical protein
MTHARTLPAGRLEEAQVRFAQGESVKSIARSLGVTWQSLWGVVKGSEPKSSPKSEPQPRPRTKQTGRAQNCLDNVDRWTWGSVGEAVVDALADYAQTPGNAELLRRKLEKCLSGRDDWGHNYTRDRLLAELKAPPESLMSEVNAMRERMLDGVPLPTTPRRRVRRGQEMGEEIDSDRFLARVPEVWDRSVREPVARRNVCVGINLGLAWFEKPKALLYRGAAALALVDYLTGQGCNVELVAYNATALPTRGVAFGVAKVVLKSSNMPLDLSAVALATCEIAFARTIMYVGAMRHWPGQAIGGWGHVSRLPKQDAKGIDFQIGTDVKSREAAENWLKDCVKQAQEPAAA